MPLYFILRPKQGFILNRDLAWKKFGDCEEGSDSAAIGLDINDAVRVASWLSYDGVTAITYPEATMMSNVEKAMGRTFPLAICQMPHSDFEKRVEEGIYPAFLLRKPANKAEKKLLSRQLEKRASEKQGDAPELFVGVTKKELDRSEVICKGDDNVFYITKPKKAMFLTKALTWISIDEIKKDKKRLSQLFVVKDSISLAQNVCQWVTASGETVSPCTPSSLKRRFNMTFPNVAEDSLQAGLRTRKYPSFLGRKAKERKEIVAFQMELRHGLKGLEERVIKAMGQTEDAAPGKAAEEISYDAADTEAKAVVELLESKYDDLSLEQSAEAESEDELLSGKSPEECVCEFKNWAVSVADSSELIRKMVGNAIAFGEMMNDVPNLLAQKKLDLEMVQRQLVDLDHMAEFYNLNASDGYRLNKNRQEILQKRRVIKNEIFVLELASNYLDNGATPARIRTFVNSVMGMDRRRYMPRAMTVSDVKRIVQNPKTQNAILGMDGN